MLFSGEQMKRLFNYFSKFEIALWSVSNLLIIVSFLIFDRENYMTLIASVIGITSLIFCAKGNPFGQLLMVIFSIIYGYISYSFAYYGEMMTYLGMTMPMAVLSLISWLKNPYKGNKSEVKVNTLKLPEILFMCLLAAVVTVIFYFILAHFNTSNLLPGTLSVTTSFIAVYLTFRRSPYFALVYGANDIVLIILWTMASFTETRYISVTVCFAAFLLNDIYSFVSWQRMKKRQINNG